MTEQNHSPDQSLPHNEQTAPPGWYPDPSSAGTQRYWNGQQWTNHFHREAGPTAKESRRDRPRTLVILGGIALAISPFLAWVNVVLIGSLNLFQLTEIAERSRSLAWITVLIGGASAIVAWRASSRAALRLVGIIVGSLAGALAVWALISMVQDVREAEGLVRVSYGPWVAALGCVAMVVGGLMATPSSATKPRVSGNPE